MKISSVNAYKKLVHIATAISCNPESWRGWSCLQITFSNVNENLQHECLFWTQSIIEAYLQDVEGEVYFCDNQSIDILCKNTPHDILSQAGQQICDLVYSESSAKSGYEIYDLASNGAEYAQSVFSHTQDLFSHPGLSADDIISAQNISDIERETPVQNTVANIDETRVLLIDDDPVTRWMVRNSLKNECLFVTAPCANRAFSMYSSFQPNVVFLDIDLPDTNGREVLNWIMRNDPGMCVVMFSSNNNLENISGSLSDGASGFIAKPFLKEHLLHYIHAYSR